MNKIDKIIDKLNELEWENLRIKDLKIINEAKKMLEDLNKDDKKETRIFDYEKAFIDIILESEFCTDEFKFMIDEGYKIKGINQIRHYYDDYEKIGYISRIPVRKSNDTISIRFDNDIDIEICTINNNLKPFELNRLYEIKKQDPKYWREKDV